MATVLQDAHARGITTVAAAGNSSSAVAYPAALPTVIAVGALGRVQTFPEDSAHALKSGNALDWTWQLFAANFTNFGPEIDVIAPGVAVTSTVPGGYAAWDGTSMAAPHVSALAALILEAYPMLRTGDALQPEYVRWILKNGATDLGMPESIQGKGLPVASRILGGAAQLRLAWQMAPGAGVI
jgi:subtilisin family serine protease